MNFEESFLMVHPLPWSVGNKDGNEYICDVNGLIIAQVWAVGAGDLVVAIMNEATS